MSLGSYWFTGWLEANSIKSADQAFAVLDRRAAFEEFVAVAQAWRSALLVPAEQDPGDAAADDGLLSTPEAIVAGPGLSPTFQEHCTHPGCVVETVERLLNVSLLYYEEVIMPDEIGDRICSESSSLPNQILERISSSRVWLDDDTRNAIRNTMIVLQHIERLGAHELIRFTPTADFAIDRVEWGDVVTRVRRFIRGGLRYDWHGDYNAATVFHESADHSWLFTFMYGDLPVDEDLALVTGVLLPRYLRELAVTFSNCAHFNAPLGNLDRFYDRLQAHAIGNGRKPASTFLMPSLRRVPAAELVDIRLRRPEVFAKVRQDLAAARDKVGDDGDAGAEFDATVLQPAFREIERILADCSQKLQRETSLAALFAAVPTMYSVLNAPNSKAAIVAGALGFTAALKAPASTYIEKRQRLHKNPYYLLWESVHRD